MQTKKKEHLSDCDCDCNMCVPNGAEGPNDINEEKYCDHKKEKQPCEHSNDGDSSQL